MKLTDAQIEKLRWLQDRGGSGVLDRYGRMVAGGDAGHPAWQQSWLNLVAKGLLAGGDDRLTITDKGRAELVPNAIAQGREHSERPAGAEG